MPSTTSRSRTRSSPRSTARRPRAPSTSGRDRATAEAVARAPTMEYRRLGSSDLDVSEIALGSWLTFGGGVERDRAVACVDRAFELGINFIDTANVYGRGAAEEFLGEVLSTRPRDSYVLATKLYFPMGDGDRGLSRAQILKQIDASLLAAADRLRRPLPVPPLRPGDAARGDDGGAQRGRSGRQGSLPRLQRVVGRPDRGRARAAGRGAVRLEPAAVLAALAPARARGHPADAGRRGSRRSCGLRSARAC